MPSKDVVVSSDKYRPLGSAKYSLTAKYAWYTTYEDTENYIELVFNFVHNITGFAIGGDHRTNTPKFVKKFKFFSKVFHWDSWSPVMINGTGVR